MGKIDKERLLKMLPSYLCVDIRRSIEKFPEEPEIDFDALYDEYYSSLHIIANRGMPYKDTNAVAFRDFLKSKNLTAPNRVEIDENAIRCYDCGGIEFKKYNDSGLLACTDCGQFYDTVKPFEIPVRKKRLEYLKVMKMVL